MRRSLKVIVIGALTAGIAAGGLTGCGGSPRTTEKEPLKVLGPPPRPPEVPPVQAVSVSAQLQTSARQEIRQAFGSNDPVLRANALEAAQLTLGPQAAELVLRGLSDSDPLVRFAAAMAAGQLRLREAYRPMLRLVHDRDTRVRIGVRYALHRLGDTRFSHDLEKTAQDADKFIRGQTAQVLGMLGEPSALKILRVMITDSEPLVRLQAAEAMWRLGDQQGLSALVTASISRFGDDQLVSVLAMAQPRDRRVLEHIRGKLTSDWEEVAQAAARAMGMLGSDEGYGVAMKGVRSGDARQKALAALAFGAIGRADAQQYLEPLMQDSDPSVRLAAATALLQIGRSSYTQAR